MRLSRGRRLLILGVALVVIDQVIKILVKTRMTIGESIPVAGSWFQLLFIENEGMAFGMKFGGVAGKLFLSLFRIGLFAFLCHWITVLGRKGLRLSDGTFRKAPAGALIGLTLITAGALGNLIDSLFYGLVFSASTPAAVAQFGGHYAPFLFGKVVDMFYFPLIDTTWPAWLPFVGGRHFIFFAPVFNFADACVSVGAVYLLLFQYRFFFTDSGKKKEPRSGRSAGRENFHCSNLGK